MYDKSRSIFCKVFIKSSGYWNFLRRYDIFSPEAYIQCFLSRIKRKTRDNGGYLLYEKLLSFDGSSENASQLDSGLWYTAGIGCKRCGFCTGRTGFWIIKKNVFRWKQSVPVVPESVLQSRIKDGKCKNSILKNRTHVILSWRICQEWKSLAKADELMQQWAYETFDGNNIPMCEFTMLKASRKDTMVLFYIWITDWSIPVDL